MDEVPELTHGMAARQTIGRYHIKFYGGKFFAFEPDHIVDNSDGYHVVDKVQLKVHIHNSYNEWRVNNPGAKDVKTSFINEVVSYMERDGYIPEGSVDTGLIYVNNGILDTQKMELVKSTPDLFVPIRIPVTFDHNAKCPHIDTFFRDIVTDKKSGVCDENDILTLEEMFGYLLEPTYFIRKGIILLGNGHNGKCLIKGSLMLTDKGIVKIEDLVNGHTDIENEYRKADISQTELMDHLNKYFEDGDSEYADNTKNIKNVISISPKLDYEPYKIFGKYNMGESDVITIRSNLGFEITGTHEHRVIVINERGNLEFKKLENIVPGDYVALAYNTQVYNSELKLGYSYRKNKDAKNIKTMENVKYMNEDIARLLGYVISEGNAGWNSLDNLNDLENSSSFQNCQNFQITTYDKEMQDDIIGICAKFGVECAYSYDSRKNEDRDNIVGIRINSISFADFMYYLGYRHLAQNKEVPWSILQADKNCQIAFLRALFDGDGYVGITGAAENVVLEYGSSSNVLCRQLQIMMMNMGIVGNLSTKKGAKLIYKDKTREYEESYRLTFYGVDILAYNNLIGFGLSRKKEILEKCVEKLENSERRNHMIVPFIGNKLRTLYNRLILLGRMRGLVINDRGKIKFLVAKEYLRYHKCDIAYFCAENKTSKLTLEKILRIMRPVVEKNFDNNKNINEIYSYMKKINERFIFDKITEIHEGRETVYDVTIENVHSYIGNCMINHNTTYFNLMSEFCGYDNVSRLDLYAFSDRFSIPELHNKLVNIGDDFGKDKLQGQARGLIKQLTGNVKQLMARRMRSNPFNFFSRAKMYFGCNDLPSVKLSDQAFIERWVILRLLNEYPDNKTFLQTLTTESELSGLLNRALDGLVRLREQKQFSKSETQGYKELREMFERAHIKDSRIVRSDQLVTIPLNFGKNK